MFVLTTTDIIIRVAVAVGLGTIIGIERTLAGKGAGMRTYSMITLGSSVFVLISQLVIISVGITPVINPLVIPAAVITGIGFLGAGLIIFQSNKITGLTTAAGLWVSTGVGIATAFGLFDLALITTIAALFIFTLMWFLENIFKKHSYTPETESIAIENQEKKFFNVSEE